MTNYSIFYLSVIKSSFIGNLTPTSSKLLPLHNPLADLHGHCHTNNHDHDHRSRYLPSGKCIQEMESCTSFAEFQCFLSAGGEQENDCYQCDHEDPAFFDFVFQTHREQDCQKDTGTDHNSTCTYEEFFPCTDRLRFEKSRDHGKNACCQCDACCGQIFGYHVFFSGKWQGHQEIHSMMITVIGNRSDGDTETYKDHIAYEKNTSVCLDKQINDPNRKNNEIRFYIYLE